MSSQSTPPPDKPGPAGPQHGPAADPAVGARDRPVGDLDQRVLRDALGRFVTGVTIVTTRTERGPLGITANSFAAVSLAPPLVLWSPARTSARFPAFEAASHFAIHVLAADQRQLAERFARKGEDFADLDLEDGLIGSHGPLPLLRGCVARFECAHAAGHDGGDHLIVVGEVLRQAQTDAAPLVYHRGDYCALAEGA